MIANGLMYIVLLIFVVTKGTEIEVVFGHSSLSTFISTTAAAAAAAAAVLMVKTAAASPMTLSKM